VTYPRFLLVAAMLPILALGCRHSEASNALPPADGPGAAPLPSPPKVDDNDTESALADRILRATGSTQAIQQADLGPKASGVLAAVFVEEGAKVKKGQPLFRLEGTNSALMVKQAEAGLAMAKVGLSRAELDYNRMKPLLDQGAISQANWDAVRIGYDQAKVGVQQAEAAVASSRAYAADTMVVAPFAGIITSKRKSAGETVTMMPPTTVIVLQDLSKIEVRVKLAESALTRIKPGEPMQVRFNSLNTDQSVPISRINPAVDPMSRTVEIIGVIPNEDRALKAGMLVEVTFPNSAPTTTPTPLTAPSSPTPTAGLKPTTSNKTKSQP
jgi:RND family efflux transporter MFP subunit